MAIVIEDGKKTTNFLGIGAWVVFLLIIGAAVYYIFFAAPELVVISPSGNLDTIAPIATFSVHPDQLVNSPAFQALKSTVTLPTSTGPAAVGRPNPFITP